MRLALAVSGLTTAGCTGMLPPFPSQFVQQNHITAGPSWTTAASSKEESEPDTVTRAAGVYLQYERRLGKHVYLQLPFETVSASKVQKGALDTPAEFSSLYFTPAIEVRWPSDWWLQWFVSGGAGLARFRPDERLLSGSNVPARSIRKWAPFVNFGWDVHLGAHWGIRTDIRGRYVAPDFVEHSFSRASLSVLPVFRF